MKAQYTTRSPRPPWRLRTRLALVLLGMVITLSVLLAITHLEDLKDRRNSRVETLQTIGSTVAASIDGFASDLETLTLSTSITLGQVAGSAGGTQLNQQNLGPYLHQLVQSYGTLRALFLTDLNGRVIASDTGDSPGFDLSSRDYIKELQSGKDNVWSGAFAGSQTGETTMTQGRVVRSIDGTPYFFLVAAFYTDQLSSRLPNDLPKDADISLIDENGTVMYNSQNLPGDRLDVSQSPVFQQAHAGQTVLLKSQESPLGNEKLYGAFVPVQRNGWVVGFTRPSSLVDGPLVSRFRRDMAIIIGLLVVGYALILLITSRLSRPLGMLANTADAIARGERPSMPIAAADADVRVLQEAMSSMSQAIADRELRLQTQTRVLETLERVGETLATELDLERAVESVAHAALDLTQSDATAFFYYPPDSQGTGLMAIQVFSGALKDIEPKPIAEDDPFLISTLEGHLMHAEDARFLPGAVRERHVAGEGSASAQSLLGLPVISRGGKVQGALILLHSRSKWYNENYIHLATGLARRGSVIVENARLYSEAQAIQDELRRSNTAKDEFIGVMSHELRTPITTIYGGARLLHARRRHLDESDVDEMVASIEEEAERLYRLVENLLALARIDLGEVVEGEPISAGPAIEQAVKQFVTRHPSRPVEVKIQENIAPAKGETAYIHQVIHNLVTNADKYSEAGQPIEVDVSQEGDEITVRVTDHGKGVAPEELDQIFESFFRSARTARDARGKGLGLTVCKRLVETMSGRIWARNRDEGGLEVGFTLPVALESQEEREPAETASPAIPN